MQGNHDHQQKKTLFLSKPIVLIVVFFLSLVLTSPLTAYPVALAQTPHLFSANLPTRWSMGSGADNAKIETGKVRLDGHILFKIAVPAITTNRQDSDPSPIQERIASIENTLKQVVNQSSNPQSLKITAKTDANSNLPIISIGDRYLMTVTTLDAQLYGHEPQRMAERLTRIIQQALIRAQQERQPRSIIRQSILAAIVLSFAIAINFGLAQFGQRVRIERQQLKARLAPDSQIDTGSASGARVAANATLDRQHKQRQHWELTDLQHRLLQLARVGIWSSTTLFLLGLYPYTRWLQPVLLSTPLKLLIIGLGIYAATRIIDVAIDRLSEVLVRGELSDSRASERLNLRVSTFTRVFKSGAVVIAIGFGILASLSVIGVDVIPLLAGAGIIGLAISFAAQSLIKDIINGFFILLEDQYAVGDVIAVDNVSGLVENMNLRITQLRDSEGQLITVPNSAIAIVRNLSKDWSRVDLTVTLAYGTDPDRGLTTIKDVAQQLARDPQWREKMPEPPEVLGIDRIDHTGILIRVWIKTLPLEQWTVAREFRRRLTLALEAEGLAIGVPQQSLWFNSSLELDGKQPR